MLVFRKIIAYELNEWYYNFSKIQSSGLLIGAIGQQLFKRKTRRLFIQGFWVHISRSVVLNTFKWEALSKNLIQKKFLRFSVSDWKSRQCYILITLASYLPTNNLITINPVLIIRALLPWGFMWSSLYTGLLIQAILLNMIHPSMMERYRNHINGIYKRKTGWHRLFFRCPMWFFKTYEYALCFTQSSLDFLWNLSREVLKNKQNSPGKSTRCGRFLFIIAS